MAHSLRGGGRTVAEAVREVMLAAFVGMVAATVLRTIGIDWSGFVVVVGWTAFWLVLLGRIVRRMRRRGRDAAGLPRLERAPSDQRVPRGLSPDTRSPGSLPSGPPVGVKR
jgi:hypothetical protein